MPQAGADARVFQLGKHLLENGELLFRRRIALFQRPRKVGVNPGKAQRRRVRDLPGGRKGLARQSA